jgi:hypothetical protein
VHHYRPLQWVSFFFASQGFWEHIPIAIIEELKFNKVSPNGVFHFIISNSVMSATHLFY